MVVNCVACRNVYSKNPNIKFHTFPFKHPELLKLWVIAIGRDDWQPSTTSRLCSCHFKNNDYHENKLLKPDSVPSIFTCPKGLRKEVKFKKMIQYRYHSISTSNNEIKDTDNMNTNELTQELQLKPAGTNTNKLTEKVQFETVATQTGTQIDKIEKSIVLRRKIKTLKQTVRRQTQKIASMKHSINELSKNQCSINNLPERAHQN